MANTIVYIIIIFAIIFAAGCGSSQPLQPVDEGKTQIIASFGGPIIPFDGFAIPVPYLNVGAVYGTTNDFSVFGNAHITAALFKDVGLDGGFVTTIIEENGSVPAVNINGRLYFFWDIVRSDNKRIFPLVTATAHYSVGERSLFYFGADNLFQIHRFEYFLSPLIGYQFPLSSSMDSQVELKWLAANKETRHGIFEGTSSISGHGGVGIFFGINFPLE